MRHYDIGQKRAVCGCEIPFSHTLHVGALATGEGHHKQDAFISSYPAGGLCVFLFFDVISGSPHSRLKFSNVYSLRKD